MTTVPISDIWYWPIDTIEDSSIESFDYIKIWEDRHGANNFTKTDSYSFTTHCTDTWLLPSKSYLLVKFKLEKATGANYKWESTGTGGTKVEADNVSLSDNAFNIIKEARYYIGEKEVERIEHVGLATLLNNILEYDLDKCKSIEYLQLWFGAKGKERQKYIRSKEGKLEFLLPINRIFSFFKNRHHCWHGNVYHRLVLTLNNDKELIESDDNVPSGKTSVESITWQIPKVNPSENIKSDLLKKLSSNDVKTFHYDQLNVYKNHPQNNKEIRLQLSTNISDPRNIFIAFQNKTRLEEEKYSSMNFEKPDIEDISIELNGKKYPDRVIKTDLEHYYNFISACKNNTSGTVNFPEWNELYPLYHINLQSSGISNVNYPNIIVNIKYDTLPATAYIIWVFIISRQTAHLVTQNGEMRIA